MSEEGNIDLLEQEFPRRCEPPDLRPGKWTLVSARASDAQPKVSNSPVPNSSEHLSSPKS